MKILISGCSFTQWPEFPGGPNICWPRYLNEQNPEWTIKNLAEPGAGNQYIADSVIRHLLDNPNENYDEVLVMWTGVSRLDFLTSLEDPAWNDMYNSYGFYRRVDACPDKMGYIFSGGQMGTWFNNPVAEKMFREMYKVSNPLSLATINLMEMIKLKGFLESRGLKYRFMSYVNYWGDGEYVSRNGDFGVGRFKETKVLIDSLKLDDWIFTDGQRNGLNELSIKNNDFQEDGFHPGDKTQEEWARFVGDKLKNS